MARVKAFALTIETFDDLICRGSLFKFKDFPKDARVVQVSHDFPTRSLNILVQSQTYPELGPLEHVEMEYLPIEVWSLKS